MPGEVAAPGDFRPPQRAGRLRLGLQQFHLHGQLPDPLMALCVIALAFLERGGSRRSRHCSSRKISTPNWATGCTGCHAKAAGPHACAPPSIAGSTSAPAGKAWPGENRQARPHFQAATFFSKLSVCSGPPWTLRLSQFCVQGNRVRLNIPINRPIDESEDGLIEYEISYGRPGRLKYTIKQKKRIHFVVSDQGKIVAINWVDE